MWARRRRRVAVGADRRSVAGGSHVHLAGGERGVDARTEWSGRLLGASLAVHQRSVTTVVAALVVGTIVIGCLTLAVLHARLKRRRPDRGGPRAITVGGHTDDDVLQVIVVVRDQEAELEIQLDGFETYGELRELVVDAVPQMFKPDDALLMEYADRGGWTRVKTKTPVDVVKNARSVRIKCEADKISKKIARRAREDHFELGNAIARHPTDTRICALQISRRPPWGRAAPPMEAFNV